jgi:hypothetical protein
MLNIHSLIEVRAPYFALEQLDVRSAGIATAKVNVQQPRGRELGELAAAEAGRHLAILGSCACASLAPEAGKHFYLAHRALLVRAMSPRQVSHGPLLLQARALERDRRGASARCELRDAREQLLFELSVSYHVLSERLFHRMFAAHRRDQRERDRVDRAIDDATLASLRRNPYLKTLEVDLLSVSDEEGVAFLPEVRAEHCAGHFPLYPAMPIALLMHGLSSLAGEVLRARYGESVRYLVTSADVSAEQLAFAGQSLRFTAKWLTSSGDKDEFLTSATSSQGASVGEMRLVLQR